MADEPQETVAEEIPAEAPPEETPKEESPDESVNNETPQEEVAEPAEEVEAPAEEEGEEEAPQQMSRRKAKRLEKLESLVERLKRDETPSQKRDGIDYRQLLNADEEVYEQLETKSQEYGQQQYNAGLEQAKSIQFHTRLEIDAPRVEAKYPQFDKESSDFNPSLADTVNQWYLATVGYDPKSDTVQNAKVRYSEFVEGIMDLADGMAGAKSTQTTKNIAKQAASTGLRPDGSSATRLDLSKAPDQMTNDELNAVINQNLPRDNRGRFTSQN